MAKQKPLEIELTYLALRGPLPAEDHYLCGRMPIVIKPNRDSAAESYGVAMLPLQDYVVLGVGAEVAETCLGRFRRTGDVARSFNPDLTTKAWKAISDVGKYKDLPVRVLTYILDKPCEKLREK